MTDTLPVNNRHPTNPDLEPRLWCSTCSRFKPLSDFHRKPSITRGYQHQCKACQAIGHRERRARTPNPKTVRVASRREQVGPLIAQGHTYEKIAEMVGVHVSTIQSDARALSVGRYAKDRPRTPSKTNVTVASNAVEQMASMASLIHDGIRPVLDLEGLTIDPETAAAWERQLARIGKAVRYLRTTMKGNQT